MRIIRIIILAAVALTLCGCPPHPPVEVRYNVVLNYISCHNNSLSHYAELQLADYEKGYLPAENSKDVFLVYAHLEGRAPELSRYCKDRKGSFVKEILKTYPEDTKSLNSRQITQVLDDAESFYKAETRTLVISSHGSSFLPQPDSKGFLSKSTVPMVGALGPDDNYCIEIPELRSALSKYHYKCLFFDCCYMSGIEVAYEFKDIADYFIASPTEVMSAGMLRSSMIPYLFDQKDFESSIEKVCMSYMDHVYNDEGEYSYYGYGTVAAVKCSELEDLASCCRSIFANHREEIEYLPLSSVQKMYSSEAYRWLFDFSDFVEKIADEEEMSAFNERLSDVVIYRATTPEFLNLKIKKYCGLSSYIPKSADTSINRFYQSLLWNKAVSLVL